MDDSVECAYGMYNFKKLNHTLMEDRSKNIQQNSPAQGQTTENRIKPDAPTINDSKAALAKDDLLQGTAGRELNPEYGDAADPTDEKLSTGGRDDASPLNTSTT